MIFVLVADRGTESCRSAASQRSLKRLAWHCRGVDPEVPLQLLVQQSVGKTFHLRGQFEVELSEPFFAERQQADLNHVPDIHPARVMVDSLAVERDLRHERKRISEGLEVVASEQLVVFDFPGL